MGGGGGPTLLVFLSPKRLSRFFRVERNSLELNCRDEGVWSIVRPPDEPGDPEQKLASSGVNSGSGRPRGGLGVGWLMFLFLTGVCPRPRRRIGDVRRCSGELSDDSCIMMGERQHSARQVLPCGGECGRVSGTGGGELERRRYERAGGLWL